MKELIPHLVLLFCLYSPLLAEELEEIPSQEIELAELQEQEEQPPAVAAALSTQEKAAVPSASSEPTEISYNTLLPTLDIQGLGVIHGTVPVVSGSYTEQANDLSIAGPIPMNLSRNYSSANPAWMALHTGWDIDQLAWCHLYRQRNAGSIQQATHSGKIKNSILYFSEGAGVIQTGGTRISDRPKDYSLYNNEDSYKGACHLPMIEGGKTHRRNLSYQVNGRRIGTKRIYIEDGSGALRSFFSSERFQYEDKDPLKINESLLFPLEEILYPNQFFTRFACHQDEKKNKLLSCRKTTPQFSSFSFFGPTKAHYGTFTLTSPFFEKNRGLNHSYTISASNGRKVCYSLKPHETFKKKEFHYLTNVQLFTPQKNTPYFTYSYSYEKQKGDEHKKLIQKNLPEGRCLNIEYYQKGDKDQVNPTLKPNSSCRGKVKKLLSPVHSTRELKTLYSFQYDKDQTTVFNARNTATYYTYKKHRITNIRAPYLTTQLFWSDEKALLPGTLTKKILSSKEGEKLSEETYGYDLQGNLAKHTLTGNLTGEGTHSLSTTYSYEQNGRAKNLLSKVKDLRTQTSVTYYPDTDLVQAIYQTGDAFQKRQFYRYNEDNILIEKILDDGTDSDPKNLANVSFRKITSITLTSQGLPETTIESYYNPETSTINSSLKTHITYDSLGQIIKKELLSYENAWILEKTWSYTYDDAGRCTSEINPIGEESARTYDALGNILTETDDILTQTHTYDLLNRRTSTTKTGEGIDLTEHWTYDLCGNITKQQDTQGNDTLFFYDLENRLVKKILPTGTQETYSYDALGNQTTSTDANGNTTTQTYTIQGKCTSITYPDGSCETTTYTIDGLPQKKVATDGLITRYEYDAFGRVTKEEWSHSGEILKTIENRYNTFFLLETIENSQRTTRYTYNHKGQLTQETLEDKITKYRYDTLGRKIAERSYSTSTNWIEIQESYDVLNRVTSSFETNETNAIYNKQTVVYNRQGEVISKTSWLSNEPITTYYDYDILGNLTKTTDPNGRETTTFYEYVPFQTTTTQANGVQSLNIKDPLGRTCSLSLFSPEKELIQQEEYTYDGNGNKIQEVLHALEKGTCLRSVTNLFSYDNRDRLIEQREALGTPEEKTTRYTYDSEGRKTSLLKPDGTTIYFTYDTLGRLSTKTDCQNTLSYSYTYDNLGRLIHLTNDLTDQTTSRTYDIYDNVVQETLETGLCFARSFDLLDRKESLRLPDESEVRYLYEGSLLKQVQRWKEGFQYAQTYSYDSLGRVIEKELPLSSGRTSLAYDKTSRWTKLEHPHYKLEAAGYDPVYNLLGLKRVDFLGETNTSYSYDWLSQLTAETGNHKHTYAYDSLYNRTEKDSALYENNSLNQLVSLPGTEYRYDANGNLIEISSLTERLLLSYDTLDRLIQIEKLQERAFYEYDGFHRRTKKTTQRKELDTWRTTNQEHYLYDGTREIGTSSRGIVTHFRTLGSGSGAEIGAAIAIETPEKTYTPLHDPFGHMALLLDAETAEPLQAFSLSAYGECTLQNHKKELLLLQDSLTPWILSSKRYDTETGFTLYGLRYYSPEIGRWITPDPAGFADGINLYTYARNNPLLYTDLYGLSASSAAWSFCSTLFTEVAIYAGIGVVTLFNPAAGVYLGYARTMYNIGSLGYTGYQIGNAIYDSAQAEGLKGVKATMTEIGVQFTSPENLAALGASLVSGRFAKALPKFGSNKLNSLQKHEFKKANQMGAAGRSTALKIDQLGKNSLLGKPKITPPSTILGWAAGDPINHLTKAGNMPSWTTVKRRHWINRLLASPEEFSSKNADRIKMGLSPEVLNKRLSIWEKLELHHIPSRKDGGFFDFIEVTSSQHAQIDPWRNLGK